MPDNVDPKVAANVPVATRIVTYSSDASQNIQIVGLAFLTGSDDAKTATDLVPGQAVMASSIPVVIASNQSAIPISELPAGTNNIGDVDVLTLPALVAGTANIGDVDVLTLPALVAGTANIGDVDVLTVPVDPFGVNADAASATGSVSAKLRHLAAVGLAGMTSLPTGTNNIGDVDVLTLPALVAGTANIGDVDVLTLPALVAGTANIGDVDVLTLPALVAGTANIGDVDVVSMKPDGTNTMPSLDAVSRAGFVKITDGTLTAGLVDETGASAVDVQAIGGGTPHDSVNSGNPILNGAEAIAHGTNPTAVAAADRTKLYANRAGVLFVIGGHPNIITLRLQFTAAQTDVAVITVSAGTKIVVTGFQFTLDNASTVFPSMRLGFATTNTPTTTGVIGAHGGVPAGGGFGRGDASGILGVGADGEDLRITTVGAATGNGCELVVTYYTIES